MACQLSGVIRLRAMAFLTLAPILALCSVSAPSRSAFDSRRHRVGVDLVPSPRPTNRAYFGACMKPMNPYARPRADCRTSSREELRSPRRRRPASRGPTGEGISRGASVAPYDKSRRRPRSRSWWSSFAEYPRVRTLVDRPRLIAGALLREAQRRSGPFLILPTVRRPLERLDRRTAGRCRDTFDPLQPFLFDHPARTGDDLDNLVRVIIWGKKSHVVSPIPELASAQLLLVSEAKADALPATLVVPESVRSSDQRPTVGLRLRFYVTLLALSSTTWSKWR